MSGDRTERATPQRRQKAQEKGDRVRSRELLAACGMLAGVLTIGQVAEHWVRNWSIAYQKFLALGVPHAWQEGHAIETMLALRQAGWIVLSPLLLIFGGTLTAVLLPGVVQGGGLQINAEALQPKFTRYNPWINLKNLFSLRSMTRLGKSLAPAAVLMFFVIRALHEQMWIPPMSLVRLLHMFGAAYSLLLDTAWILFAWSAVDYVVEWRSWESRLKMSKQEIREEFKQSEGNPQIKGKLRSIRRQMRRRQLKADVRRASVIITNPTHYAIALSFDFETMEPPKVLVKGRDLLAEQIKDEARWAGIPIVENPPLARSIYRYVEPGQTIPYHLYAAVAAILAYLYRQQVEDRVRKERMRQRAAENTLPKQPISTDGAARR